MEAENRRGLPITKPNQGSCEGTIPGVTLFYIAGWVSSS
jgi:hypothetical protein